MNKAEQECHMLSEETQRGIKSLRVDMERGGIHLCPGNHITHNTMLCSQNNVGNLFPLKTFLYKSPCLQIN
jgi:hypothetical protein